MAYARKPRYSGGRDQKNHGSVRGVNVVGNKGRNVSGNGKETNGRSNFVLDKGDGKASLKANT
jgi:hypothetical protein